MTWVFRIGNLSVAIIPGSHDSSPFVVADARRRFLANVNIYVCKCKDIYTCIYSSMITCGIIHYKAHTLFLCLSVKGIDVSCTGTS